VSGHLLNIFIGARGRKLKLLFLFDFWLAGRIAVKWRLARDFALRTLDFK
jgi:hypothetical protein